MIFRPIIKMTFDDFKTMATVSMENICRDIFLKNRESIKIKKEPLVVKNLMTIFNATLKLSNAKGFHAMSLRDLCRETGLSMGGLYSYFSSKDELLKIIQKQGGDMVSAILNQHIEAALFPKDKLETAIQTHLYLSEVLQPWFFFSYMETRYFRKEEHEKAIANELYTEKLLIDILNLGNEQNVFNATEPMLTAALIKAMLQDWYLKRWKYRRRNVSIDTYADFVIQIVETSILI